MTELTNVNWSYGKNQCTMAQYATSSNSYLVLNGYGGINYSAANTGCVFYPVVYLDKDVYITEGEGTKDNPYQIAI